MFSSEFFRKAFYIFIFGAMALLLAACDSVETVRDQQTIKQLTLPPTPSSCNKAAEPAFYSLDESIKKSSQIILGKVVKLDPYVWNTPDGKAPADLCTFSFDPYIPVHVQVLDSFKGNLIKDSEVTLLVMHDNNSIPPLNLPHIPINPGDELVWFLGKMENYRYNNNSNPLNYPEIFARYVKREGEWHHYLYSGSFKDTDELRQLIQNPPPTPSPKK